MCRQQVFDDGDRFDLISTSLSEVNAQWQNPETVSNGFLFSKKPVVTGLTPRC
jgi:hypothetical protein